MADRKAPVELAPKPSTDEKDHALIVPASSSLGVETGSPSTTATEDGGGKGSSTLAALSRTLIATLAFLFKRPIRLFRPVKISTWAGIQAIAHEHGLRTVNRQFVRNLIKKEGAIIGVHQWKFIPRHVLPPMVVNALIGLTLFTSYTTSERLLLRHFTLPAATTLNPLIEFIYIPFVSGSIAGAAQSILSTPLDNARLLLLRRQRYLRQSASGTGPVGPGSRPGKSSRRKGKTKRPAPGGLPFSSWYQLLRDSLFQSANINSGLSASSLAGSSQTTSATSSKTPKALARERRIEQARQWARKGWSLFGLTLVKDSIGFGVFFATFELGREASRRLGLSIDGITAVAHHASDEGRDRAEYETEEKKRRTFTGIVVQGLGILLSGGIAGYVFAGIGRPFERMRGAVWEGRTRWSERDAKLALIEEAAKRRESQGEESLKKDKRRGRSIGGKSERRARKLLGAKKRKIGMVRIGQIKGTAANAKGGNWLSKRRLSARKTSDGKGSDRRSPSSRARVRPGSASSQRAPRPTPHDLSRTPPPSAPSLILSALSRYGPANFLFAPRSVLQSIDERLPRLASTSASQATFPALTSSLGTTRTVGAQDANKSGSRSKLRELDGPTRFIAKRRHLQELDRLKRAVDGNSSTGGRGWRIVSKVFTFVPPYAVGFLVYALVQGDLKAEV